jgi:hypothetical protein
MVVAPKINENFTLKLFIIIKYFNEFTCLFITITAAVPNPEFTYTNAFIFIDLINMFTFFIAKTCLCGLLYFDRSGGKCSQSILKI